jgi:hypothetical protein
LAPVLAGRLDSSWAWTEAGGQSLGLVTGWAGLTAGTRDVKSEVRLGLANLPAPAVSLSRAWAKFRVPGLRVTTGLGRLGWGPGLVLVPGDLLFDSVGTEPDFSGDELRSNGAWLGDLWLSLGDESFAEATVLARAAGLRVSAAPGGVSLEAAAAWDQAARVAKAALSAQVHWGLDWYATVRQDAALNQPLALDRTSAGAGAFGLWDAGSGWTVTSRHEAWGIDPGPSARVQTYHDLTVASDEGWSVTGRALTSAFPWTAMPLAEVRWSPLQNLSLYVTSTLSSPWAFRVGTQARW